MEPVETAIEGMHIDRHPYLNRFDLDGLHSGEPVNADHGTRTRLLESAITLFASHGFNACSMREIAKAVNIGAPAIYNYYASKTDILIAALDSVLCTFYSDIFQNPIPAKPEAALYCILRRHVLFGIAHRTFARAADALLNPELMLRELPETHKHRYFAAMKVYRVILRELIEAIVGEDSGLDLDLQAFLVHELVDRAGEWYEPDSAMEPEALAEQCLAAVKRLLTVPRPRKPKA
ncbi:TetR/AcrR family transcriptional regulator [Pseudomonas sp. dw_358]|uniref:TetR/AcrR family transcriptional regulator n=1 Tax=Pseudomonas sp. dw_358 TaxID=2720083 RepID=UPI001BD681BE|nr:TetR/AcrR family transcriptional regulator [Pseudomonas sp. dw_358]